MRTKPIAVFMAFGTKGDVYPIAAIAAAFASDQKQYEVAFLTHSAHQSLKGHLGAKGIAYFPISSPPVLSSHQDNDTKGPEDISFSLQKKEITRKHRQECISAVEGILGEDPVISGDLIFINFFALEGWSLAELFHVRCVVAAPYVVPYSAPSSFERQFRNELPLLYKYLRESRAGEIGWADIIHWMWPLFTGDWGKWRSLDLKLSFLPFTDPITDLPTWHDRPSSPLLLYGFSQEIVESPDGVCHPCTFAPEKGCYLMCGLKRSDFPANVCQLWNIPWEKGLHVLWAHRFVPPGLCRPLTSNIKRRWKL